MKVVLLAGGYGTRISEESHLKLTPVKEGEPESIVADVFCSKNELFWQPTFDLPTRLDKKLIGGERISV